MPGRAYDVIDSRVVSTAITVLEITNGANYVLEVVRAWFTNTSSSTSAEADCSLVRKTAGITSSNTVTPVKKEGGSPSAGFSCKRTATAEGTDGDLLAGEGFNVLNGWLYVPVPEERIWVPAGGLIALKLQAAPASATYRYGISVIEHG